MKENLEVSKNILIVESENDKYFIKALTVLKAIKSHDSTYADCLNNWKICLEQKNKTIKPKKFDKFWLNIYLRYDCCTKNEQC